MCLINNALVGERILTLLNKIFRYGLLSYLVMLKNRSTQRQQKLLSVMAFGFVGFTAGVRVCYEMTVHCPASICDLPVCMTLCRHVVITHYSIAGMRLTIWNCLHSTLPTLMQHFAGRSLAL
jgi:hypothetical protein